MPHRNRDGRIVRPACSPGTFDVEVKNVARSFDRSIATAAPFVIVSVHLFISLVDGLNISLAAGAREMPSP